MRNSFANPCEAKTKDCALSRSIQHRLRQHCPRFWSLKEFLTCPSINYVKRNEGVFHVIGAQNRMRWRIFDGIQAMCFKIEERLASKVPFFLNHFGDKKCMVQKLYALFFFRKIMSVPRRNFSGVSNILHSKSAAIWIYVKQFVALLDFMLKYLFRMEQIANLKLYASRKPSKLKVSSTVNTK